MNCYSSSLNVTLLDKLKPSIEFLCNGGDKIERRAVMEMAPRVTTSDCCKESRFNELKESLTEAREKEKKDGKKEP